jgi:isopentenyldiphosphate isomerase
MPKLKHMKSSFTSCFFSFVLNSKMKLCYSSAPVKIPFAVLWTNTLQSRSDGETNIQAGSRRLFEDGF